MLDQPPPANSPFLPTLLELCLVAIYPSTLLVGSLFSTLHRDTRNTTYVPHQQAFQASSAPSYFAKKTNAFNLYFVKIGWFWTTLAFFLLLISNRNFGPPLQPVLTRKRLQALLRYSCVTLVWIAVTQWFFGPPIIDRSFRWTGGKCERMMREWDEGGAEKQVHAVLTHAACKAIGGQWKGGHDISGHVFLLILGSAMLSLEMLPLFLKMKGLREARRILTSDGFVRSANVEKEDGGKQNQQEIEAAAAEKTSIGVKVSLMVAGLMGWMLLMTAAYFHTWFEKFTGLCVAFGAIYFVYFLPRGVPVLRHILGMPGV
ncbi:hypothetical protein M433DRAFT_72845 [Acidomyces richmondensis BFW]|nr:MAG: hypothetical protein FE78DRAFT_138588 [Acidomyces sp. 'richmondensis']KYG42904.1 hypothetical protein M433DRAFT_72845 [Acidomyces richmondensis BFW]